MAYNVSGFRCFETYPIAILTSVTSVIIHWRSDEACYSWGTGASRPTHITDSHTIEGCSVKGEAPEASRLAVPLSQALFDDPGQMAESPKEIGRSKRDQTAPIDPSYHCYTIGGGHQMTWTASSTSLLLASCTRVVFIRLLRLVIEIIVWSYPSSQYIHWWWEYNIMDVILGFLQICNSTITDIDKFNYLHTFMTCFNYYKLYRSYSFPFLSHSYTSIYGSSNKASVTQAVTSMLKHSCSTLFPFTGNHNTTDCSIKKNVSYNSA